MKIICYQHIHNTLYIIPIKHNPTNCTLMHGDDLNISLNLIKLNLQTNSLSIILLVLSRVYETKLIAGFPTDVQHFIYFSNQFSSFKMASLVVLFAYEIKSFTSKQGRYKNYTEDIMLQFCHCYQQQVGQNFVS